MSTSVADRPPPPDAARPAGARTRILPSPVTGQELTLLGVIAAIKGLGRLGQLRGGAGAERFIVGTFASVLWAAAWAGLAWLAVRGAAHGALGFTS